MQAEKQDVADTDPNVENKVNATSDTDPLRQCVLWLGTQTKYNPAVATTTERKETAGDRRHSVHAYRRIPPNRIERMNCAIIEQIRTTMPLHGGQFRPHTVEPRRNSASINQVNRQVVPWPA